MITQILFATGEFNELCTVSGDNRIASLKDNFTGYVVDNVLGKRLTNRLTVVNIEDTAQLILVQQAVTHQVVLKTRIV